MAARVDHPMCARLYVRQSRQAERLGLAARRAQLLDGVAGKVIEAGAGTGLNFAHYPASVVEVVAAEPTGICASTRSGLRARRPSR